MYWQVIEFEPSAIKSIQKIESTNYSDHISWNINEVDLNKTIVFGSCSSDNTYDENYYNLNTAYSLLNSTLVGFGTNIAATRDHYIYVVEFN